MSALEIENAKQRKVGRRFSFPLQYKYNSDHSTNATPRKERKRTSLQRALCARRVRPARGGRVFAEDESLRALRARTVLRATLSLPDNATRRRDDPLPLTKTNTKTKPKTRIQKRNELKTKTNRSSRRTCSCGTPSRRTSTRRTRWTRSGALFLFLFLVLFPSLARARRAAHIRSVASRAEPGANDGRLPRTTTNRTHRRLP
jgi:hypothetical protein